MLVGIQANAQYSPKQITIVLSPIIISNGKYYFESKRVKFEDIMLPLISLNDQKINNRIKIIQTLKDIRKPIWLASTLYFLYLNSDPNQSVTNFDLSRNILIASTISILSLEIFDIIVKRNTVKQYNEIILQPAASLLPSNKLNIGIGIRIRF